MSEILDDKSEHCTNFILDCLERRSTNTQELPLFVMVNGCQGSGKTTLVSIIAEKLNQPPRSLPTIVFSIDDLYLTHEDQLQLASSHPRNPLVQHRGQPSTHDLPLALALFSDLRRGKETKLPSYDKSTYDGQGDRAPKESWAVLNQAGQNRTKVVIFEGWCVGFRALPEEQLQQKWEKARSQRETAEYQGRLGLNKFEDVKFVNEALRGYDLITDQFDALIHLDAEDPRYVFRWRMQQELKLREAKGSGMTEEQVTHFVNGYYPAYELFTDSLRAGVFDHAKGRQLRLILSKDRSIKEVIYM